MKPIHEMPQSTRSRITGLFTDIDDTITTDGRLPASSYEALERLTRAGLITVAITGRPAGWCDMIARFWPVSAVIGENGAFYFQYDHENKKMVRRFIQTIEERRAGREQLKHIEARILSEVEGAAVASDQGYRESDLAIDFAEDVPKLKRKDIEKIAKIFEEEGATAKISSIHVNGWYGKYDKLTMTKIFASEYMNISLDDNKLNYIYCGDSPNDEPMFGYFPISCGVANVIDFLDQIEVLPKYIASNRGAAGFVEIVDSILSPSHAKKLL